MEGAVVGVGADGEGLGVVLEGVGWGFGAFVDYAEGLALLEEREVGVGTEAGDAAGCHVAGHAEVHAVGLVAHRLELGDGDVVALGVAGCGDGEPDDCRDDDGAGDEELYGRLLSGGSLGRRHTTYSLLAEVDGEGALLVAGLKGEFEELDGAKAVFGGDGEGGGAEDGIADVGVEETVVAVEGGELCHFELGGFGWVRGDGEGAPGGFGFGEPVGGGAEQGRAGFVFEGLLLGVEAVLYEAAVGAVGVEARSVGGGDHGGVAFVAKRVAGEVVVEEDVEGVVDGGDVAVVADAGGDRRRGAVEGERLVDEVRAEVEEQAVGLTGSLLPGARALDWAEAVEVGADRDDAAEGVGGDEFAEGLEVAVEAAVVEGAEELALLGGEGDELASLGGGGGEGLVDDDVLVGEEGDGRLARRGWRWGWR